MKPNLGFPSQKNTDLSFNIPTKAYFTHKKKNPTVIFFFFFFVILCAQKHGSAGCHGFMCTIPIHSSVALYPVTLLNYNYWCLRILYCRIRVVSAGRRIDLFKGSSYNLCDASHLGNHKEMSFNLLSCGIVVKVKTLHYKTGPPLMNQRWVSIAFWALWSYSMYKSLMPSLKAVLFTSKSNLNEYMTAHIFLYIYNAWTDKMYNLNAMQVPKYTLKINIT